MAVRYYDPNNYLERAASLMGGSSAIEPLQITAGDVVKWQKAISGFPASNWMLSYSLRNADQKIDIGGEDVTADPDGIAFDINVAPVDSSAWAPGDYVYQAFVTCTVAVTLGGQLYAIGDRLTIEQGKITILANLAAPQPFDSRSHNKIMLDAITAVLEGRATSDVMEYTIGSRHLRKMAPMELEEWRGLYEQRVRIERQRAGEILPPKNVGVSF